MRPAVLACAVCALAAAEEKPAAEPPLAPVEMKRVLPPVDTQQKVCSIPLTNVLRPAPPVRMPMMQPRGNYTMPFVTVPAPPCDEKPAPPMRLSGKPSGR